MKKFEVLLIAILGGFAATCLFLSREYNPTAALFPRVIAVASLLFLVLNVIGGWRELRDGGLFRLRRDRPPSLNSPHPPILALQAGYVVLIYLIGFFVATLLYLIIAPIQLRYERRGVAIATSVVLTLLLASSFMWLFDIQLPQGAVWELL